MRGDDTSNFSNFVRYLVPCVAGKKVYDKDTMGSKTLSEAVTVNTEAFAHLIFENGYDRWVAQAKQILKERETSETSADTSPADGTEASEEVALQDGDNGSKPSLKRKVDVPTLYTMTKKGRKQTSLSGWSNEGKTRFNELIEKVTNDRKENNWWDDNFKQRAARWNDVEGARNRTAEAPQEPQVVCGRNIGCGMFDPIGCPAGQP